MIIQDLTGNFMGAKSTIFSHNVLVGDSVADCVYENNWNGYYCENN